MTRFVTTFIAFGLTLVAIAQDAPYPVFESDKAPHSELAQRRKTLMATMDPGSIGVFFTNPEQVRNNDVDFMFRADSDFLYLTGFEEPESALILVPGGVVLGGKRVEEILFCNVSTQMSITWLGYRMGPSNAMKLLGVQEAQSNKEFASVFADVVRLVAPKSVYSTNVPPSGDMQGAFTSWKASSVTPAKSAEQTLSRMREIKSPFEIRMMQLAVDASVAGHIEVLKSIKPGMREYQMGGLVKYVFEQYGCEYPGYPPIVGSGPNSTILHYNTNRRMMNAGEIVCMDAAGEYHGYSADVTRSFPVNGKFSVEQRAIYEIVLAATDAGIALCEPGATRNSVTQAVNAVLVEGLVRLGLIADAKGLGTYYMHGWGHGIGLDVHDPWPTSTFAPGMMFTVEPGIYIKEGSPCDKKWWNIGIRIEDDILITQSGNVNMSISAPRTIDDIERMMGKG